MKVDKKNEFYFNILDKLVNRKNVIIFLIIISNVWSYLDITFCLVYITSKIYSHLVYTPIHI